MWKTAFKKFYLIHTWMPWPICLLISTSTTIAIKFIRNAKIIGFKLVNKELKSQNNTISTYLLIFPVTKSNVFRKELTLRCAITNFWIFSFVKSSVWLTPFSTFAVKLELVFLNKTFRKTKIKSLQIEKSTLYRTNRFLAKTVMLF